MAKAETVVLNQDTDEKVIQELAACLRTNGGLARQLRDFADTLENEQRVQGLNWQPRAGQILVCHFGLEFREPEMVKPSRDGDFPQSYAVDKTTHRPPHQ